MQKVRFFTLSFMIIAPILSLLSSSCFLKRSQYKTELSYISRVLEQSSFQRRYKMDDVMYKKHPVPVISKDNLRRVKKPLMEKKRRARINSCLDELKRLVLQAWHKQGSHFSKLEKADILDLTVRYLKSVHNVQLATAVSDEHVMQTNYRSGFSDCAHHVVQYLNASSGVTDDLRLRLTGHMASCVHAVSATQYPIPANSIQISQQQVIPTRSVYTQIPTNMDTVYEKNVFSCQSGSSVSLRYVHGIEQCSDSCMSSAHTKNVSTNSGFGNLSTPFKPSGSGSDCDSDVSCSYSDDEFPAVDVGPQVPSPSQSGYIHSNYHVPTVKQDSDYGYHVLPVKQDRAGLAYQQNETMWRPW